MGSRMRAAGLGLRLMARMPGLLLEAHLSYRRFRRQFVAGAKAEGMPEEAALALAERMKPARLAGGLQAAFGHRRRRLDTE